VAEILGAIQRGLGAALNAIYEVIPSYAVAIILLTIIVRALMIPLTVKQVRSMTAMQKLAPEQKKIQAKYKDLQKKATNRQELQALRLQMNQEVQGLFKAHGVNPLGGCLPLLAQFPVYIGMFSIMRAAILALPAVALVFGTVATGSDGTQSNIPASTYSEKDLRSTVCIPTVPPSVDGPAPTEIVCRTPGATEEKKFIVGDFRTKDGEPLPDTGGWIATCRPGVNKGANAASADDDTIGFQCTSSVGTGHLPKDGKLFEAVTLDNAELMSGVHAGCTAAQAASKVRILECTNKEEHGGGAHAIPYYLLIAGIIGTQYYQGKQMLKKATGPAADTQRTMMKIMPVFIGFVSLNIPAGANLYFLVSNAWTIGQQHILLAHKEDAENGAPESNGKTKGKKNVIDGKEFAPLAPRARTTAGGNVGSKKRKKKKKR
jgi:YidC/Oxa1 family membrane protein insertase